MVSAKREPVLKSGQGAKKILLWVILVLGMLGLVTSIYLAKSHYVPPKAGSFCDVSETVSCSIVNTSKYSEIFGVSIAIFGAIWFAVLLIIAWRMLKKDSGFLTTWLLGWSVLGIVSVAYLVYAEFMLQAICLLCTLVHVIIILTLLIAIYLYVKQPDKPSLKSVLKVSKPAIIVLIIINLIPFVFVLFSSDDETHDNLAKCLTEKGVREYGSITCSSCKAQEKAFGSSFQYIDYVECHPRGPNPQTNLCLRRDIKKTPTFILEINGEEVKRIAGFQTFEALAEFAACEDALTQDAQASRNKLAKTS
ncbi:hypothetical protein HYV81_04040 [Candidatus Woesearchaeota archaeon]|nr:hypothetical protein [Candidatus Woesearchaeota archaeon]